jgi:hypothetical protein
MEMPSALPVGVAAFVGRARERAKVAELVAGARVVTLTGYLVTADVQRYRFADGGRSTTRGSASTRPRGSCSRRTIR